MRIPNKFNGYSPDGSRLYSKGGGKSETTASIPAELRPLATAYTNKALDLSNQGYTPYTDQRYADLNQYQTQGADAIYQRAAGGDATMNAGASALQGMLNSTTNNNPYLDSMVNRAQESVISNYKNATAGSGSFGNSGVEEALSRGLADVSSNMYGNAYNTDQANKLSAANLAPAYGNQAYTDASQMIKAGQMYQDQAQQGLDFNYQQFADEQNLPYKQLAAMSGVFGSNLGQTQTTQQSGGK